jgi:hypothetical protein
VTLLGPPLQTDVSRIPTRISGPTRCSQLSPMRLTATSLLRAPPPKPSELADRSLTDWAHPGSEARSAGTGLSHKKRRRSPLEDDLPDDSLWRGSPMGRVLKGFDVKRALDHQASLSGVGCHLLGRVMLVGAFDRQTRYPLRGVPPHGSATAMPTCVRTLTSGASGAAAPHGRPGASYPRRHRTWSGGRCDSRHLRGASPSKPDRPVADWHRSWWSQGDGETRSLACVALSPNGRVQAENPAKPVQIAIRHGILSVTGSLLM